MVGRPRGNVVSSPDVGQESVARNQSAGELGGSSVPEGRRSSWLDGLVGWLTTHGERAGNVLVYSSAYLAVIAMVYVAIVMVLLGLPANLAPLVGGLVTFAVYTNDRLVDLDADEATNPERTAFVRRHKDTLYVLAAAAYGIAVMLSVLGGPVSLAITLMPAAIWVLYATDWIPGVLFHFGRLKEVLVVNSAVVAFSWAFSATILPIEFTDATFTTTAGFVLGYFFLRSFANTEIPNVRDVESDRESGVATLPVVLGVDRTRQILYAVDILTIGIVGFAMTFGHLPTLSALALSVGVVYSLGVTSFVGRIEDGKLLALAAECEYVIVGLALIPVVYGV